MTLAQYLGKNEIPEDLLVSLSSSSEQKADPVATKRKDHPSESVSDSEE
jgi:hypothetical protein